jgi:hypothetical protein
MDGPKHDVGWVLALGIMSLIEDKVPEGEHDKFMRQIYARIMAGLDAYEAYSNQIYEIEPSEN